MKLNSEAHQKNDWIESVIGPPNGRAVRVPLVAPHERHFVACYEQLSHEAGSKHEDCPRYAGRVECACRCHKG